jgi:hypothetical protein
VKQESDGGWDGWMKDGEVEKMDTTWCQKIDSNKLE